MPSTEDLPAAHQEEEGFDPMITDTAGVALMHLPPMQRELFLRIHQQQQDSAKQKKEDSAETGDDPANKEKGNKMP